MRKAFFSIALFVVPLNARATGPLKPGTPRILRLQVYPLASTPLRAVPAVLEELRLLGERHSVAVPPLGSGNLAAIHSVIAALADQNVTTLGELHAHLAAHSGSDQVESWELLREKVTLLAPLAGQELTLAQKLFNQVHHAHAIAKALIDDGRMIRTQRELPNDDSIIEAGQRAHVAAKSHLLYLNGIDDDLLSAANEAVERLKVAASWAAERKKKAPPRPDSSPAADASSGAPAPTEQEIDEQPRHFVVTNSHDHSLDGRAVLIGPLSKKISDISLRDLRKVKELHFQGGDGSIVSRSLKLKGLTETPTDPRRDRIAVSVTYETHHASARNDFVRMTLYNKKEFRWRPQVIIEIWSAGRPLWSVTLESAPS